MTETEFLQQVKVLFDAIEYKLEQEYEDLDVQRHGAFLEIENGDGDKVVINQQAFMNEVWLASRAGGHHFKWLDAQWVNTRDGASFMSYLDTAIAVLTL